MLPPEDAVDWDPPNRGRQYYKRTDSGDLGWLVVRDGKKCIRYDRACQELLSSEMHRWKEAEAINRVPKLQAARVAFEADKALCMSLGDHALSRREWLSLRDKERISFMNRGPDEDADPLRQELWLYITTFFEGVQQ